MDPMEAHAAQKALRRDADKRQYVAIWNEAIEAAASVPRRLGGVGMKFAEDAILALMKDPANEPPRKIRAVEGLSDRMSFNDYNNGGEPHHQSVIDAKDARIAELEGALREIEALQSSAHGEDQVPYSMAATARAMLAKGGE